MNKQNTITGLCKLCKEEKPLTYEHIPPRSAFNKTTKFYELNSKEYYQNAKDFSDGKLKPRAKVNQGGLGSYCLCRSCNEYLGQKYVRDYKKFAEIAYAVISKQKDVRCFEIDISDINLLNFTKQIIASFICQNKTDFTKYYEGLIDFVINKSSNNLPERYKIYMYLNDEGNIRSGNLMYTNIAGALCEFTFKPFGFVLSIDNPQPIYELTNITDFKNFNPQLKYNDVIIKLNKYPTILPFPLDYRQSNEIK